MSLPVIIYTGYFFEMVFVPCLMHVQSSGSKPLIQIESKKKQGTFRVEDKKSSRVTKSQSQQAGDEATSIANESKMHDGCKLNGNHFIFFYEHWGRISTTIL